MSVEIPAVESTKTKKRTHAKIPVNNFMPSSEEEKPDVVVHALNPSTWEAQAEAGGSLWI